MGPDLVEAFGESHTDDVRPAVGVRDEPERRIRSTLPAAPDPPKCLRTVPRSVLAEERLAVCAAFPTTQRVLAVFSQFSETPSLTFPLVLVAGIVGLTVVGARRHRGVGPEPRINGRSNRDATRRAGAGIDGAGGFHDGSGGF